MCFVCVNFGFLDFAIFGFLSEIFAAKRLVIKDLIQFLLGLMNCGLKLNSEQDFESSCFSSFW